MRDPQTVPAKTFDHFDFFFPRLAVRFFFPTGSIFSSDFFFFHWFGLQFWFFFFPTSSVFSSGFFFFFKASVSLGTKKKRLHRLIGMGSQIV